MTARLPALFIRCILLLALTASAAGAAPAQAAPRAQVGAFLPVFSFFGALAARNRVYRTAEEFIDDANAHYNKLRETARRQYVNRDLATIGPSQLAAYIKVVVILEKERQGTLAVAETLKREARGEFQQRLQNAITAALLGTGPAQSLVGALRNGVNFSKDALAAALNQLAGNAGGALADVARIKRAADLMNAVGGNIGGQTGRTLRGIAGRISRITDNLDRIEDELRQVQQDLDELDGNVKEVEEFQRVLNGTVTGREAGIYVLTGQTDNPVLEAIIGILRRKSTDASGLRETARQGILQGFVVRCVAKANRLLQAMAELRGGPPVEWIRSSPPARRWKGRQQQTPRPRPRLCSQ